MDLQLKEQTSELLDPTWKDVRNKHLLNKMLELEQPTITVKVTNYCCKWNVYAHFAKSCMCIFFIATDDWLPAPRRRVWLIDELYHTQLAWLCSPGSHRHSLCCIEEVVQVSAMFRQIAYLSISHVSHFPPFRAVILLSPDNPTEALNSFLAKKAALITKRIFDVSPLCWYRITLCLLCWLARLVILPT